MQNEIKMFIYEEEKMKPIVKSAEVVSSFFRDYSSSHKHRLAGLQTDSIGNIAMHHCELQLALLAAAIAATIAIIQFIERLERVVVCLLQLWRSFSLQNRRFGVANRRRRFALLHMRRSFVARSDGSRRRIG